MTAVPSDRSPMLVSNPADPLARLEPVTLAEIDATASLQTRVDRKYVIARGELDALLVALGPRALGPRALGPRALGPREVRLASLRLSKFSRSTVPIQTQAPRARVLEIDGVRSMGYESTYFDTPDRRCFHDAARSRPDRFKVRTRTYLDTNTHVLEVKTRGRDKHTVKARRIVEPADHRSLSIAGRDHVVDTVQRQLSGRSTTAIRATVDSLAPSLRTSYQRTTLLIGEPSGPGAPDRSTRATIDTALGFSDPGRDAVDVVYPDVVIVETKTAGPASPVDQLLWRSGHRPVKVSKYGSGLALLYPDLPATKWNRVLRRCFDWRRDDDMVL